MSDVNMNDPKLFLYQSGYLTIKKVVGSSYMLGYPNRSAKCDAGHEPSQQLDKDLVRKKMQ